MRFRFLWPIFILILFVFLFTLPVLGFSQPVPPRPGPPGPPPSARYMPPPPPQPGMVWVPGHWEGVGRYRRWMPGHWAPATAPGRVHSPGVVVVPEPTPQGIILEPAPPEEIEPSPIPEPDEGMDNFVFILPAANFKTDKWDILPDGKIELKNAVETLKEAGYPEIIISGHTDSAGSETYNMKLSERRADSVKNYLVTLGYPAENITAYGYGETMPIASNETAEGRAQNRRVQIELANP